ncbi:RNA ligase/cyclic nucleotide phosphodiesterase family [Zostera marina]|uniref:RNA ligase/cyclic nucleotide phosphodiesterase family n=1 Tax=Zostera marina TaxID=29655 RepID=A0A0K9PJA4_ZOSMR|nr:RNA ligase/cyclic nucleotide phosphodiesterase family [Zostera marina]
MSQEQEENPNFNPYDGHQHSYAIELYFDPALENQVLKAWNVLARRQITTHLISISSRPHITLLVVSSSNPNAPSPPPSAALHSAIRTFATRSEPFPICLTSVATAGSNSLFLLPTPTMPLLQMHSRLCEAVGKEGVEVGEEYRPDTWLPCCSLAEDVSKSSMAEAFGVLKDMKLPVAGYVMDIGIVEFGNTGYGPVKELFSIQLGGNGAGAGLQDA